MLRNTASFLTITSQGWKAMFIRWKKKNKNVQKFYRKSETSKRILVGRTDGRRERWPRATLRCENSVMTSHTPDIWSIRQFKTEALGFPLPFGILVKNLLHEQ